MQNTALKIWRLLLMMLISIQDMVMDMATDMVMDKTINKILGLKNYSKDKTIKATQVSGFYYLIMII